MNRSIENRINTLEKKLNPEPLENDRVIIYFAKEGIPEELLNDNVPHIFIPDNGRDPKFEPIHKGEAEASNRAIQDQKKAQCFH